MIWYQCKTCGIDTQGATCPVCKKRTERTSKLYWCSHCKIPLYEQCCPICKKQGIKFTTDARPVFPEERLLLELILGKPFCFLGQSVWNASGWFYADGKRISLSAKKLKEQDTEKIREGLMQFRSQNSYTQFEKQIERFLFANKDRKDQIETEALSYIKEASETYQIDEMFVSFSGGKDSTVTSDLVRKALGTPKILHLFGDTTLEFPHTKEYVNRFKKEHPQTPMLSSVNKEKNFYEVCEQLGPPSRVMRWCCTIFKTGAISRKIQTLFGNKKRILTFYGIRRSESTSRNKYDRTSESPKITKQVVISPIIDWYDFDVWLYMLGNRLDFNMAYRLGYARVGCFCCPNNSGWSEFLSRIYLPQETDQFRRHLVSFARKVGKPDAEEYVDSGNWKARQGGNGLEFSGRSVVSFTPCATAENILHFDLQRPISEDLYELFKPFGFRNDEMGNKRLHEVYITEKNNNPVLKLAGRIGTTHLTVTLYQNSIGKAKSKRNAQDKIKCQITKYQMCMGCMACTSVCKHNAITIKQTEEGISYQISDNKCVHCSECVNHYEGGCYIRKVLAIKRNHLQQGRNEWIK